MTKARFVNPNSTGGNVVLAHTLRGAPASGSVVMDNASGRSSSIQQASAFSTAPYKDPRAGKCKAKDDTCVARAVKGTDYCVGHERSMSETSYCLGKEGKCKAPPIKGTEYCVGHSRSMGLIENWGRDGKKAV